MDSVQLYEIRRRIHDWRNHSPNIIYSMLDQLAQTQLDIKAILQSKIHKTIKSLSEVDLKEEKHKPSMFEWNDYNKVIAKAKAVSHRLVSNLQQDQIKHLKQQGMQIEEPRQPTKPKQQRVKVNLFQGFSEQYTGYVERLPFLNAIAHQIIANLESWRESNKEQIHDIDNIKKTVIGLEKEIYHRNLFRESKKMAYEMDVKTLLQFLRRDKSGSVTIRVFNGSLSYQQAALLKSDDWIDEVTRKEQIRVQQEKLESEQIGFYKDLRKREMEDVEGKQCKGCHQKRVYLVEEKQTRCADEPTTKFFECFNCGDKFRMCG